MSLSDTSTTCEWCGKSLEKAHVKGPRPRYCCQSHRQRAYEARQTTQLEKRIAELDAETKRLREALEGLLHRWEKQGVPQEESWDRQYLIAHSDDLAAARQALNKADTNPAKQMIDEAKKEHAEHWLKQRPGGFKADTHEHRFFMEVPYGIRCRCGFAIRADTK